MGNLILKDPYFKGKKEILLHLKNNSLKDLYECIGYIKENYPTI